MEGEKAKVSKVLGGGERGGSGGRGERENGKRHHYCEGGRGWREEGVEEGERKREREREGGREGRGEGGGITRAAVPGGRRGKWGKEGRGRE